MGATAICLVISNDFSMPAATTICSFLTHNPGQWNLFIITDNLDKQNEKKLKKNVKRFSELSSISIITAEEESLKRFPKGIITRHVTKHALFKLLIAELLPKEIKKVLYLDSDVIVNKNISELLELQSTDPVVAIKDFKYFERRKQFGIEKYFNSGVMLLNLELWRSNSFSTKLLASKTPEWNKFVDQDILNNFFNNKWTTASEYLNVPALLLYQNNSEYNLQNSKIIHFLGGLKPWDYWLPYSPLYWKYLIRTPYWYHIFKAPITVLNSILYKLKKVIKR